MKSCVRAQAGKTDITPTDLAQVYLAGFGPNRKADRVIDPIYARAFYLSDGASEFAFVALDLLGMLAPDVQLLRESCGDIDPDRIWVACTHTHSAPDTMGLWGPAPFAEIPLRSGVDRRYINFIIQETSRLLRRLKRTARPATLHAAIDRSPKSEMTWNIRDQNIMDPELSTLWVRRADDDRTIALVTNFGAHPETLFEFNSGISPDFPTHLHARVESELGGTSIFLNGALGAMVTPGIERSASLKNRLSFYRDYGEWLGDLAVASTARTQPLEIENIILKEKKFFMPMANRLMTFAGNFGILNRVFDYRGVETTAGILELGPARFIASPGEVQPELGLAIKSLVGGSPRFLVSLCNDELGYLLPEDYWDDQNYQYEMSVSPSRHASASLLSVYRSLLDAPDP